MVYYLGGSLNGAFALISVLGIALFLGIVLAILFPSR